MGRRLSAMEERHGARLLLRLPGRYALAPLGESVLGNAERIEAEVLAAERTITGRDVALAGTVRLTTVDTLALGIYGSPKWLEAGNDTDVRLITVLDDQAHLPEAKWLRELYPDAGIGFRSNSREVQVWAAKSGAGISAIARYRADTEPDLVRLRTDIPDLTRDIWLGVHNDTRHMPRVRAVMDAIIAALSEQQAILNPKS